MAEKAPTTTTWQEVDDHPLFRRKLLEKLNSPEQLDQLMVVTSGRGWLALVTLALLFAIALAWSVLAQVESAVPGDGILRPTAQGEGLEAVLYVSMRDGERIRPNQYVKVALRAFRQEEYGLVWGIVEGVGRTPSSTAEMLGVLQTDALVQSLVASGQIVEVRVRLLRGETPSGYQWTSADGPPVTIMPGTLAQGNVIVDSVRPIQLLWMH